LSVFLQVRFGDRLGGFPISFLHLERIFSAKKRVNFIIIICYNIKFSIISIDHRQFNQQPTRKSPFTPLSPANNLPLSIAIKCKHRPSTIQPAADKENPLRSALANKLLRPTAYAPRRLLPSSTPAANKEIPLPALANTNLLRSIINSPER